MTTEDKTIGHIGTADEYIIPDPRPRVAEICTEIGAAFFTIAGTLRTSISMDDEGDEALGLQDTVEGFGDDAFIEIHAKLKWIMDCYEARFCFDSEVPYTDEPPKNS